MSSRLSTLLLLLIALTLAQPVFALGVGVIVSQRGGLDHSVVEALKTATANTDAQILHSVLFQDLEEHTPRDGIDLLLAIGAPAVEAVVAQGTLPVIATLVSRHQIESTLRRHPGARVSAIVLDQPELRHLGLAAALLPDVHRAGIVFGPETVSLESRFAAAADRMRLGLDVEFIAHAGELVPALDRLLRSSDVLLALPDSLTSSPSAARALLLSSYRARRPVLAYSRAYVDAGALAAVYSAPGDIVRDLVDWLSELADDHDALSAPPEIRSPRHYSLAVNRQVARALGLTLPSDEQILRQIERGGAR